MTQRTTLHTRQFFAVMGLSYICMAATPVYAAGPTELSGGMTAYQFDGVYKGNTQRISANDESCRPGQEAAVEVRHGRLMLPWTDRQVFDAKIARDGSFYATTGVPPVLAEKHMSVIPTLQGHIGATGLVADYGTRWCRYRLEASQAAPLQHLSQRIDAGDTRR
jgi:hypothetical protein